MSVPLVYKDTVRLVKTYVDGYGTERVDDIVEVPALFLQNTGWEHSGNQSLVDSDAEAYIDFNHSFVVDNFKRLEGMPLIYNPLDADDNDCWYRIEEVIVGEDKLLTNSVDNVKLRLKKTAPILETS